MDDLDALVGQHRVEGLDGSGSPGFWRALGRGADDAVHVDPILCRLHVHDADERGADDGRPDPGHPA